jgi:hypothetical protein
MHVDAFIKRLLQPDEQRLDLNEPGVPARADPADP